MQKRCDAPEAAGVRFIDADDVDGPGVRLKRIAAMDRALEALQRRRRRWSTLAPSAQKELREQIGYLQARREVAELELVELIELAELPVELMGWA